MNWGIGNLEHIYILTIINKILLSPGVQMNNQKNLTIEEELAMEHIKKSKEDGEFDRSYYQWITEDRIRQIVREELRKHERNKNIR